LFRDKLCLGSLAAVRKSFGDNLADQIPENQFANILGVSPKHTEIMKYLRALGRK
jgi:hypothetical protein